MVLQPDGPGFRSGTVSAPAAHEALLGDHSITAPAGSAGSSSRPTGRFAQITPSPSRRGSVLRIVLCFGALIGALSWPQVSAVPGRRPALGRRIHRPLHVPAGPVGPTGAPNRPSGPPSLSARCTATSAPARAPTPSTSSPASYAPHANANSTCPPCCHNVARPRRHRLPTYSACRRRPRQVQHRNERIDVRPTRG